MTLSEWFKKPGNKTTQDAFGILIGVTQGRVSQIAKHGTRDFLMMRKISEATGGQVAVHELLPPGNLAEADEGVRA